MDIFFLDKLSVRCKTVSHGSIIVANKWKVSKEAAIYVAE
jgi:hypothetical protein